MKITTQIARVLVLTCSLATATGGEVLYNGIRLPDVWPPKPEDLTREPLATPPWLLAPPPVIPIDVGRQLFVDDFLIEKTTLTRTHHLAKYHPANPVIGPDQPWEGKAGRARTAMFSDGVWFDPADKLFKLWYWAGPGPAPSPLYSTCLATSRDGVHWEKPAFDVVPGTNIVLQDDPDAVRNSSTVWMDLGDPDPRRKFKMFRVVIVRKQNRKVVKIHFSPDGIHWSPAGQGGECGDRSTAFFNPFRNVWVFGMRDGNKEVSRCRSYYEHNDPLNVTNWARANGGRGKSWWIGADRLDPDRADLDLRRPADRPWDLVPSQLYNLDCVAYESVMLGEFSIWRGQPLTRPKINEVTLGYSRDGFHWSRPDRRAFCGVSEKKQDWNWGNVQSAGGCCLIVGDKLHFYVGGVSGRKEPWHPDPMNVGLATLRRDGFASMDAGESKSTLTTRPVKFSGRHLFVNIATASGDLRVEVLDQEGKVIAPFAKENCEPLRTDKTLIEVKWKGTADLSKLAGQPVRFRFNLKNGALYSFWVSPDASGASHGYVAAGGPGFSKSTDTIGANALR